jgi:hypothetical protein
MGGGEGAIFWQADWLKTNRMTSRILTISWLSFDLACRWRVEAEITNLKPMSSFGRELLVFELGLCIME